MSDVEYSCRVCESLCERVTRDATYRPSSPIAAPAYQCYSTADIQQVNDGSKVPISGELMLLLTVSSTLLTYLILVPVF